MTRVQFPPIAQALALYAAAFVVFTAIIFATPAFLGTDDYYHARIAAEIIEQRRLAVDFHWLPLTILSPERFTDHHLLFHLYIAPFTVIGGIIGAKLATVSIAAGIVVAAWAFLRQNGVRFAAIWALGIFALSTPFLVRMLMIRTQGAALLLLLVGLIVLSSRRHWLLIPLTFAFTWLYDGFILMPVFTALYIAATWIADRRFEPRPLFYSLIGVGLGLVINPYFPQNIGFIWDHLVAKVDIENSVRLGNEWYPYETDTLLTNSLGALVALGLGFLAPSFREGKRDRVETLVLFVAFVTLFMLLRSRRFIEYFPPFALLFCALAWGRGGIDFGALLPRFMRWRPLIPVIGLLALLVLGAITVRDARDDAGDSRSADYFAGASAYLREYAPDGAMVFQTDWDDFTRLFYYNPENVYLVGLDPTYLQLADPDLWDQWVEITRGEVENPSAVIRSVFGAEYVVSDSAHDDFEDQAARDPFMEVVYEDRYNVVWHILPDESR
ncbi:MAG: hypothetical protein IAE80_20015 [Anaerolinea sp.]|nr:hypothetical protein [Anaerolinea sp.]